MRFLLIKIFVFIPIFAFTQNADSLLMLINQAKTDTLKMRLQCQLGKTKNIQRISYWDSIVVSADNLPNSKQKAQVLNHVGNELLYLNNPQLSYKTYKKTLAIYLKLNDHSGVATSFNAIGNTCNAVSNYKEADQFYNKSLAIAATINNKSLMAACHGNIGGLYYSQGEYSKALEERNKSLQLFEELNDSLEIGTLLREIGEVYLATNQFDKSLEYYRQALKIFENKKNNKKSVITLRAISAAYVNLSKFDEALLYENKSFELAQKNKLNISLNSHYNSLGNIYVGQTKYEEAINAYKKALLAPKANNYKFDAAVNLFNLGECYFNVKNYKDAENYAKQALQASNEINDLQGVYLCHDLLSRVYKLTHQTDSAFLHFQKSVSVRDSLYNEEQTKKLVRTEMNYEFDKKELALKLQEEKKMNLFRLDRERESYTKNIIIIISVSLLFIGAIVGYVLYRTSKQKQTIKELERNELKQKLLLTQMNPHFIFNSIDNIQSLIGKNDKEAISYLSKFSKLTRQILEYSNESYISFSEEISCMENYLKIQQLLYNQSFQYEIHISEDIDEESIFVPPMLTQPFVENAIKHGLQGMSSGGHVVIDFTFIDNKLWFEIIDNGKGFLEKKKDSQHKSLAMSITKERLKFYHQNKPFAIDAQNRVNSEGIIIGAKIKFEIPYIYE